MTALSLLAPAKLNLFLHVTGRRADGYHELQTLFQLLDYGDRMRFAPQETRFFPAHRGHLMPLRPCAENNLVLRARLNLPGFSGSGPALYFP